MSPFLKLYPINKFRWNRRPRLWPARDVKADCVS